MIVGIDEVGRGCIAGPVCVAAVGWDEELSGVADSKTLSAVRRVALAEAIRQQATMVGIGWAGHELIDRLGIVAALCQAARQALAPFGQPEVILLDGSHNYLGDPSVKTIIDGDASVPLISAASIIAKVARDTYMQAIARQFPGYGFERHVGYLTKAHRAALETLGPCLVHRRSFAPVRELIHVH